MADLIPDSYLPDYSPKLLLDGLADYHGTIHDITLDLVVSADMLRAGQAALLSGMRACGLSEGDRVLVAVSNGPLFIAVWTALLAAGSSPIPVHFETPIRELKRTAERFHAAWVVSDLWNETQMENERVRPFVLSCGWQQAVFGLWEGDRSIRFSDEMSCSLPGIPLHPTSGTTGNPKLAVRPIVTAVAEVVNYVETFGIRSSDMILNVTPMCHAFGHGFCAVAPLMTGASLVTMRKFQPRLVVEACQKFDITILPAAAAVLDVLIFTAGKRLYSQARKVFTGGGPVNSRTVNKYLEAAGSSPRPLYGSTEAGGIAVVREGGCALDGCVGLPFKNVEIEVRQADEPDVPDNLGLIHVRSKSLMAGYLIDERVDRGALVDHWFNTGDIGRLDEKGQLILGGRIAEVINVSGMKVLPREVEEVIRTIPGVIEVKVYPKKTRLGTNTVSAAVVAESTVTVEMIREGCERGLVYYKRPSRITLIDQLPKNTSGKVVKELLP